MIRRILSVFLACVLLACATSPLGRRQLRLFPDDQMSQMGIAAYDKMKQEMPRSKDARAKSYVRCVAKAITAQAMCLVRLGRYEKAEQVMRKHPGWLMAALPTEHYEQQIHFWTLAEMYEGLGEPEKAAEYWVLLRKAEELARSAPPDGLQ